MLAALALSAWCLCNVNEWHSLDGDVIGSGQAGHCQQAGRQQQLAGHGVWLGQGPAGSVNVRG
jgi:hypothetical protein